MDIQSKTKLSDGNSIPIFGLGVFRSPSGKLTQETVSNALQIGYRHIDTAAIYGNEKDVGISVKSSGIKREDLFITTKLWNSDQGYESALKAFDRSLKLLSLDFVDLYLLHWPVPELRFESYKALIKLKKDGLVKSIGVSNFTIKHLKEFIDNFEEKPVINQVEMSPYLSQNELRKFCHDHKIQIESYSPLTKGQKLNDPALVQIARKHNKTSAQILIRWSLEMGLVTIPKSNRLERLKENADVFNFQLDEKDLNVLNHLNENYRTSWDPTEED